jgi:cation-transporting ATPase 13A3/4/5
MESVFDGEARIDMDVTSTFLNAPPPGPPNRQTLYIADEDSTIRFIGYEIIQWRARLWKLVCVLSFGILSLLGHWFPRLWLRWVANEKAFIDSVNGFVVVEVRMIIIVLPIRLLT